MNFDQYARDSGRNPMRWNCRSGANCFNLKRRPKIEMFSDCFPGRINFGDVDGLVEIGGHFCILEWKGDDGKIKTGQRITFQALTRYPGNFVLVAEGNAETMEVSRWCFYRDGRESAWREGNLQEVMAELKEWSDRSQQQPIRLG